MDTTAVDWSGLVGDVEKATVELRRSAAVPDAVSALVDALDERLHAESPRLLQADPYLTTSLFAGVARAGKALRHESVEQQRRDLRIALEQVRHALRDIASNRPFDEDTLVHAVLGAVAADLSAPQADLAALLGVSTRQLQRWLAPNGPDPSGIEESRVRVVGQLVNQLRHVFTGPGVLAWFNREHPVLGVAPACWLDDPIKYPVLLSAARSSRAMTG
jgi:hypothetical protein